MTDSAAAVWQRREALLRRPIEIWRPEIKWVAWSLITRSPQISSPAVTPGGQDQSSTIGARYENFSQRARSAHPGHNGKSFPVVAVTR